MDDRTLKALKASIQHWEDNLSAEEYEVTSVGPEACALCGLFNAAETPIEEICIGCPVSNSSGITQCAGTPYGAASMAHMHWEDNPKSDHHKRRFKEAAQTELDFLKSLLPSDGHEFS